MAANTPISRLDMVEADVLDALLGLDTEKIGSLVAKKTALLALADVKTALVALAAKKDELLALIAPEESGGT